MVFNLHSTSKLDAFEGGIKGPFSKTIVEYPAEAKTDAALKY